MPTPAAVPTPTMTPAPPTLGAPKPTAGRPIPPRRGPGGAADAVLLGRVHGRRAGEAQRPQPQAPAREPLHVRVGARHGAGARGRARDSVRVTVLAKGMPPVTTGGIPRHVCGFLHLRPPRQGRWRRLRRNGASCPTGTSRCVSCPRLRWESDCRRIGQVCCIPSSGRRPRTQSTIVFVSTSRMNIA